MKNVAVVIPPININPKLSKLRPIASAEANVSGIIPKIVDDISVTYTLICYLHDNEPKLEVIFTTKQEFNSPKLLIKTLRYFLTEMIETESEIASIGKSEGY